MLEGFVLGAVAMMMAVCAYGSLPAILMRPWFVLYLKRSAHRRERLANAVNEMLCEDPERGGAR